MKPVPCAGRAIRAMSLPARGVWIETGPVQLCLLSVWPSLPARGVWIETIRLPYAMCHRPSLPARGVWIETVSHGSFRRKSDSHSPQGECGLKHVGHLHGLPVAKSLPARGVWIETCDSTGHTADVSGHSPQGECGLKSPLCRSRWLCHGHSPQGECGLKCNSRALRVAIG